jgi:hypothetical protein
LRILAQGTGKDAKDDVPREGAAAMYTRRRPPAARNLALGMAPGAGTREAGGTGALLSGNYPGESWGARAGLVPPHPADAARMANARWQTPQNGNAGREFALDALFPLGRSAKGALRLPPPSGITDARGAGGAADRSWGGGGEGQAGLYGQPGLWGGGGGGVGGAPNAKGSDIGGQWDKIHGAAALLLGTGR